MSANSDHEELIRTWRGLLYGCWLGTAIWALGVVVMMRGCK